MEIKQEYEYNADDETDKLDHSGLYRNCDDDCNSIKVEEVEISKCNEYDSTPPTFEYLEVNKAAVKEETENIKDESCVDMDALGRTSSSSLKGMKDEQSIEIGEPSKLTADTKECIKVEKDILAFDVKAEEQESYTFIDSTKLEKLTEELHIKPDSDVGNNENSDVELDRAAKKKIDDIEHRAVHRKADKASLICYHCNFVGHSKQDLIYHINFGDCSSKTSAKKKLPFGKQLHKANKYICTKCHKIFKRRITFDDHVVKKHIELIPSVSSKIHWCKHCNYKTTISTLLASHMAKHPESGYNVKQMPCIHCDVIFKSKQALDDHVIKKHEEFIASVSSKMYQCKHCNYKTTISTLFASHMTKHPESGYTIEQNQCIHCYKTFKSKRNLDDHVVKNHKEFIVSVSSKIYQCDHCNYKTTISSLFNSHMTKHPEFGYSVEQSQCIHCDKTFNSKRSLDDHVIRKHEEHIASVSSKIYQCKHCSYRTTKTYSLATHITKHPESGCRVKRMQCIHCDAKFNKKLSLDDHVIRKHKEFISSVSSKIYECKYCSHKTTRSTDFARHISTHSESGCRVAQRPCIHCDKTFQKQIALDDHVIKKHKEFISSVSSKIHECKHCCYRTTLVNNLASHLRIHPESGCNVKRKPCIHCDKTFRADIALDDHVVKKHKEFMSSVPNKIHECKHCGYKTAISSKLASHMKKHPEFGCSVKRSQCMHCDKTFARKANLDDHIVRNHEEFISSVSSKIHGCSHCSYKTTISSSLAIHMTKHHGIGCSAKSKKTLKTM